MNRKSLVYGAAIGGTLGMLYGLVRSRTKKRTLAGEMLNVARKYLAMGVRESSENSGPLIDQWLKAVGVNPPANWCAASVSQWMKEASEALGRPMPVKGNAGVLNLMQALRESGAAEWIDVRELRTNPSLIVPGLIVIWKRGAANSGLGHIGLVEEPLGGGKFRTIEGNAGPTSDAVVRLERPLSNENLLGMLRLREPGEAPSAVGALQIPPGAALFP